MLRKKVTIYLASCLLFGIAALGADYFISWKLNEDFVRNVEKVDSIEVIHGYGATSVSVEVTGEELLAYKTELSACRVPLLRFRGRQIGGMTIRVEGDNSRWELDVDGYSLSVLRRLDLDGNVKASTRLRSRFYLTYMTTQTFPNL